MIFWCDFKFFFVFLEFDIDDSLVFIDDESIVGDDDKIGN